MTTNSSALPCPVPTEQQPLNEYQELRDSWLFRWATLDLPLYLRKLGWVWFWSWLIAGPLAAASFPPAKHPIKFFLTGSIGSGLFVLLVLLYLYLSWSYINTRLLNPTVFYEESGWYDGQTWSKPTEVLMRDRLVVTYQIAPILDRLKKTLGILVLALVLAAVGQILT